MSDTAIDARRGKSLNGMTASSHSRDPRPPWSISGRKLNHFRREVGVESARDVLAVEAEPGVAEERSGVGDGQASATDHVVPPDRRTQRVDPGVLEMRRQVVPVRVE